MSSEREAARPDRLERASPPEPEIQVEIDEQFAAFVDTAIVVQAVAATLRHQDRIDAQVAILITEDGTVQELNRSYRGVDAPTDVLSFPQQESADSAPPLLEMPEELASQLARHLGDLVIAYPYLARQANHHRTTVAEELQLLAVHGTLHLLGYDHGTAAEKRAMWSVQDAVLVSLGLTPHLDRDYD